MKTKKRIPVSILEEVAPMLRVLSHPLRLQILNILEEGPLQVSQIMELIDKPQALTSHQLGLMKQAGALKQKRQGKAVFYSIANQNLIGLLDCIRQHKITRRKS